jgi:hypothetical protein
MLRHLPDSVQVHFGSHLAYIENFDTSASASTAVAQSDDASSLATGVDKIKIQDGDADGRVDTQGKKREKGVRLHIDKPARDAHPDYPAEAHVFECDVCIGCDVRFSSSLPHFRLPTAQIPNPRD